MLQLTRTKVARSHCPEPLYERPQGDADVGDLVSGLAILAVVQLSMSHVSESQFVDRHCGADDVAMIDEPAGDKLVVLCFGLG